jgi:predicted O-methyltransferase YrrM
MTQEAWRDVDRYLTELVVKPDAALSDALEASTEAGLPPIEVAPTHAKLLHLLARMTGARRILEVGTLGGYSTIWLARALPGDGLVVTLEALQHHAEVARANFERAGLSQRVEVRVGPALESLAALESERAEPFDLVFLDADKASNPAYLEWSLQLTRPGSVIVCDNVVRGGRVLDESGSDADIAGIRTFLEHVANDPRVDATAIQTVGVKGWDGFALALVN